MIKGKEAREELVNSLSFLEKEKVVKQLANFLTELHRFPYEKLNKKPVAEGDDKKYYEKIKIKIEKLLPGKIGAKEFQDIQNFCPNFQKIYATKLRTLIHGDLRGDNFLFADGKIAVIDFSNLSVNDPANDFKGFWTYGCDFAEDIYAKYKGEKDDGFLERSRLHNKMSGIHVLLGSIEDEHCPFPFEEGYRLFKKIFYSC
jgi:aminoglycoside phosphotransferase (APT) family kinase protein